MRNLKQTKRFLLILLIGVLIYSCKKDDFDESIPTKQPEVEVSTELAKNVALNFSNNANFFLKRSEKSLKSSSPIPEFEEKEVNEIIIIPDENDSPAIYIVTFIPDGFVVVSATKKESPILGYSENSVFDFESIPYGIAIWLIDRMDKIQILKYSDSIQIPDEVEKQWVQMAPPEDEEVVVSGGTEYEQKGPLLTTLWGQGHGYNTLLDRIDGSLPPTGCVATAMAQVMKYHEFPSSYNWSAMPNTYGTNETAKLMHDIGEAVNMNYTLSGSGADMADARNALINEFGYSSSAQYVDYSSNTVVSEIKNNRPVIMDGYHTYYTTSSGWWIFNKTTHHYEDGHAWVCDGYKRTLYLTIHNPGTRYEYTTSTTSGYFLHMNWGWSGSGMGSADNSGWFKYDNFSVSNGYDFQYKNKCIIGIKP